jgi:hypothetical protein
VSGDQYEDREPTFERVRDGWVLVSAEGRVMTPDVMNDDRARAWARMTGVDFPDGPGTGHLRVVPVWGDEDG